MAKMTDHQKEGLLEGMKEIGIKDCLIFMNTNDGRSFVFPHGDLEYLARMVAGFAAKSDEIFYYLVTIIGGAAQVRGITFKLIDPNPPLKGKKGASA